MNNNNFGNTFLVIILVLIVGFGVWYFTSRTGAPAEPQGPGIQVDITGPSGDDGTPDQGPGDN